MCKFCTCIHCFRGKFTQLLIILHDCRAQRSRQISTLLIIIMMIIFFSLMSCVRHILGQTLSKFKSRSHIFFYAQKSSLIEFKLFRTWWTPPVLTHRRQHRDCNLNILSFSTRHLPGEKQSPQYALSITPYQSQYRSSLNSLVEWSHPPQQINNSDPYSCSQAPLRANKSRAREPLGREWLPWWARWAIE